MTVADDIRLEGDVVRLRMRKESDLPKFVRWYNDPEVRHWLHMSEAPEQTLDGERQRWELTRGDPTRLSFVIETTEGVPIGQVGLVAIDEAHRRAELGISIGEKAYWGRGFGTDALRVILRFAFETLDLHRIELITDADNDRGIRAYEKAGFKHEGLLRGKRQRYKQPIDMLLMSVVRPDVDA
ncbi:MAG TPA: GNAT family N-acetyltransferase [Dehalococcoidia bacterium]|nr:GNAT family N-acetyltransferase [Dehalococcoidia bacterium]